MPELPEVYTITKDLKKYVVGSEILEVTQLGEYEILSDLEDPHKLIKNTVIADAKNISKTILLNLSSGHIIAVHLAMTGKLLLRPENHADDKFARVVLRLQKKGKGYELRFCDKRKFGKFKLAKSAHEDELRIKHGPEITSAKLTPEGFVSRIQNKNTNIKNALLDQKLVSGLGNVYATDALWIAKIHPETKTRNLTHKKLENLYWACREIIEEGIKNRGISMSDYVDLLGKKGSQQDYFRVYRHENCQRCKSETEQKTISGRGTYFCPNCQILYKDLGQQKLI